jgi:hypothetical protein
MVEIDASGLKAFFLLHVLRPHEHAVLPVNRVGRSRGHEWLRTIGVG